MKLLFLLFILLRWPNETPDCNTFYAQTLSPLSIKGDLQKKEETNEYFLLQVKNEDEKIIKIQLLKNNTGRKIFNFVKDNSKIVKAKGETTIRIAAPISNGGLLVQIFPDLCE